MDGSFPMEVALAKTLSDNNASRYLSAIGYVVILYDTLLTLPEEYKLVWRSKANFAKYAFLLNKYIVMLILTLETIILNNPGNVFTVKFCRGWLIIHALFGVMSICVSNILVLLRVAVLWNDQKPVVFWMFASLFVTTGLSFISGVIGVAIWFPHITYQPEIQTCGFLPNTPNHFFAPSWGIPLIFDFHALYIIVLNSLQRPRAVDTVLARILVKDGLFYFAIVTALRLYNVLMVAIAPIELVFSGAYISWAIITVTMSRLMLHLRRPQKESIKEFEWPTGNTITAITLTETDRDPDGGRAGVPASLTHLSPNADKQVVSRGGRQAARKLVWSGEVFQHGQGVPIIPLRPYAMSTPPSRLVPTLSFRSDTASSLTSSTSFHIDASQ